MSENNARPPRENLCRAVPRGIEIRDTNDSDQGAPVLSGHFARFNEWTEIDSFWEGRFMERIAPGAFKKTFSERTPKVLFNHGHDPTLGDQALGTVRALREDDQGAYYEVDLFDGVPPLLLSGLRAGAYGASFRFSVIREEFNNHPEPSEHNPEGLPERTIKEASVAEFGPVTFPAYEGATAQARSITDMFLIGGMRASDPDRFQALLEQMRAVQERIELQRAEGPAEGQADRSADNEPASTEVAPAKATPPTVTVAPSGPLTPLRGMNTNKRKERTRL